MSRKQELSFLHYLLLVLHMERTVSCDDLSHVLQIEASLGSLMKIQAAYFVDLGA